MTLSTEILEVRQAVQTQSLQFIHVNFAVVVLVHELKNGVDDVISLLLMLNVVLWSKRNENGLVTHSHARRTLDFFWEYM